MSGKKKGGGGGGGGGDGGSWKQDDDVIQGVVIADSFNRKFTPITQELPRALIPLGNKVIIDYTIEYLLEQGIQEIIIFCCSLGEKIREHVNNTWSHRSSQVSIQCVMSSATDCISLGDALREIDREGLIRTDFLLVPGDLLSNVRLMHIVQDHKTKRKKEKNLVMTSLYKVVSPGHFSRCREEDSMIAVDPSTSRLLFSQHAHDEGNFHLPLGVLSDLANVDLRYDLSPCSIYICSPQVAPLFTDNFDYQTVDDFIRGILNNEEVMGDKINVHTIEHGYSSRMSDLHMYNAISLDFLNRWIYPLVPDSSSCQHRRHNVYYERDVRIARDCCIEESVMIGKSTTVGDVSSIKKSVIGSNCSIGKNVQIFNSYIWDDVEIGDDCVIESSVICRGCVVKRSVSMEDSIISFNVVVGPNVHLPSGTRISMHKPPDFEDDFADMDINEKETVYDSELLGSEGRGYHWPIDEEEEGDNLPRLKGDIIDSDDDASSVDSFDGSMPLSPPPEQSNLNEFYDEVVENLAHGIAEKVAADNIALEINASKYKFNIDIPELCQTLMKALVSLSVKDVTRPHTEMMKDFVKNVSVIQSLLMKYWNSPEYQMQAISAAEDYFAKYVDLGAVFATILHQLYQKDILDEDVILKWHRSPPIPADFSLEDNYTTLRENQNLTKFITWLQEADEESDEDSDDSD